MCAPKRLRDMMFHVEHLENGTQSRIDSRTINLRTGCRIATTILMFPVRNLMNDMHSKYDYYYQ